MVGLADRDQVVRAVVGGIPVDMVDLNEAAPVDEAAFTVLEDH